jgi:hypothetical protein
MGVNQSALLRLGREKRGKAQLEDLSSNLVIQLGAVTEALNRRRYETNRPILGTSLTTCRTTFGIPASLGWALLWTCPRRTPWRSLRRSFREHGRPISSASKPRRSSRASSPENAKQASDYSLRAKRSKSGPSALTSSVQRERQSCSCLAHDRHLGATWVPALSISPLCWRVLRGTGSPRIGRAPCTMHIGVSTIRYRQLSTVHWTPAISHGVA